VKKREKFNVSIKTIIFFLTYLYISFTIIAGLLLLEQRCSHEPRCEDKSIQNVIYTLLGIYLLGFALLYVFQRNLLYMPTPVYSHNYEELSLLNEDVTVQIIVLNQGNDEALIYFGGNAEPVIANAQDFSSAFGNKTIYLVNYRGYGGSSSKPTQAGLFSDALAVFDKVKTQHSQVAIMGRSLGTGVAMYVAANRVVDQLVLISPYDSILAVAQNSFPIYPVSLLLKDKYDSVALAKHVNSQVLIIVGAQDKLIPNKHSQTLASALALEPARLIVIQAAGHNNISQFPIFYQSISTFFDEYKRQTSHY
jgi:hypothetical protein